MGRHERPKTPDSDGVGVRYCGRCFTKCCDRSCWFGHGDRDDPPVAQRESQSWPVADCAVGPLRCPPHPVGDSPRGQVDHFGALDLVEAVGASGPSDQPPANGEAVGSGGGADAGSRQDVGEHADRNEDQRYDEQQVAGVARRQAFTIEPVATLTSTDRGGPATGSIGPCSLRRDQVG